MFLKLVICLKSLQFPSPMLKNAKWAFGIPTSFTWLLLYEKRKTKDFESKHRITAAFSLLSFHLSKISRMWSKGKCKLKKKRQKERKEEIPPHAHTNIKFMFALGFFFPHLKYLKL